jgi:hypothetical protein
MDTVLLAVTVVSLVVALVMSVTAWRVARDEKHRSSARVAALSLAASEPAKAPWAPAPLSVTGPSAPAATLRRQDTMREDEGWVRPNLPVPGREIPQPSGFLGTASAPQADGRVRLSAGALSGGGRRQHSLAIVAAVLFVGLASGVVWMMSGPRGTTAAAVGPNMPLELVSLRHDRQHAKLAVSGLVRNPLTGRAVERLSAVVFLFDAQGTFVTSATAPVDFMKLGVGDESPFVVAIDAPTTVARYRVSFRTNDGVVPHIDRRGAAPIATGAEQPVSVTLK